MLSALMGTRFVKIDLFFFKKVMQQVDDVFRAFVFPIQGEGGGIDGDADSTDGSLV